MEMHEITLKLPAATLAALRRIADEDDMTPGQIIRAAISAEIGRRRKAAKTPVRADERLVAPVRALLADDFAYAASWQELLLRLNRKGFGLAEAGGGLIVYETATGQRICKGSELGHGYAALVRRFHAAFPGHKHRHIAERVLAGAPGAARSGPRDLAP